MHAFYMNILFLIICSVVLCLLIAAGKLIEVRVNSLCGAANTHFDFTISALRKVITENTKTYLPRFRFFLVLLLVIVFILIILNRYYFVIIWFVILLHFAVRPIRMMSHFAYRLWQGFVISVMTVLPILLMETLIHQSMNVQPYTLIGAIIVAISYWTLGYRDTRIPPATFQTAYPWKKQKYGNIVIYSGRTMACAEAKLIVHDCYAMLEEICQLLDRPGVVQPISIFLCPDRLCYNRLTGSRRTTSGMVQGRCVVICYDGWKQSKSSVAHELAHIISAESSPIYHIPLLEEGLACFIEEHIVPHSTTPRSVIVTLRLLQLAEPVVFYGWYLNDIPDWNASETYSHAHAFVHFLIHRNGMAQFLRLYQISSSNQATDYTKRLEQAIRDVYGMSAEALEREWRYEHSVFRGGPSMYWHCISPGAKKALNAVDKVTVSYGYNQARPEHLLLAVLQQSSNVIGELLEQHNVDVKDLLHAVISLARPSDAIEPWMGWNSQTKMVFSFAVHEAVTGGYAYIGEEHLFLGLLHEQEGEAYRILTEHQICLSDFRHWLTDPDFRRRRGISDRKAPLE
jgi:hypothetical protein